MLQHKKNNPFISVITPVRNGGKTIQRTLNSIKNQSFKNFEYIIIDCLSNDNTEQIILDNKDFIDIYVRERDDGIYDAMNKGIKLANGDYISIINSDDYLNPKAFEEIYKCSLLHPKDVVFYSDMYLLYKNINKRAIIEGNISKESIYTPSVNINHPTIFIPKTIYKKYGLFEKQFKCSADRELIMRLLSKKVKFEKVSLVLASFSLGGTTSKYSFQFVKDESFSEYKLINKYTDKKTALMMSIFTFLRLLRNFLLFKMLPKKLFLKLRLLKIS